MYEVEGRFWNELLHSCRFVNIRLVALPTDGHYMVYVLLYTSNRAYSNDQTCSYNRLQNNDTATNA